MSASPKAALAVKHESGDTRNVAFILRAKNHQKTKIRRSISLTRQHPSKKIASLCGPLALESDAQQQQKLPGRPDTHIVTKLFCTTACALILQCGQATNMDYA